MGPGIFFAPYIMPKKWFWSFLKILWTFWAKTPALKSLLPTDDDYFHVLVYELNQNKEKFQFLPWNSTWAINSRIWRSSECLCRRRGGTNHLGHLRVRRVAARGWPGGRRGVLSGQSIFCHLALAWSRFDARQGLAENETCVHEFQGAAAAARRSIRRLRGLIHQLNEKSPGRRKTPELMASMSYFRTRPAY